MEANPEKDSGILGSLFQTVINDMRGSTPIWEDFTYKSMKLHSSLKTTVMTIGAFLEAFQKVADMATSSKGATREIGSALTRLCLRHRSIESHLKVLTSSILDNLVAPLQEKLEDWKKAVAQLDKDHAKEYKKAKQDIKKAASDTMRLQKKVKKGGSSHGKTEMQHKLDAAMMDVNAKYHQLEETEKNSLRSALIEERSRFCLFITCLQPFVDNELKLLTEMSHIQEIMQSLCLQASDPSSLPESSEQVISDLKGVDSSTFNFKQHQHHHSPPSSPSSLGSRKSSMCSINSINSSSSGSSKSHSPSHTMHKRTTSQPPPGAIRLTSVSSQDSGFTSQDTLFLRPNTPQSLSLYQTSASTVEKEVDGDCDSTPTTPSDNTPSASSTWNNWPNLPGPAGHGDAGRPHTISSAYEKGHARPALKPDLFQPPQEGVEMRHKPVRSMSQTQSHYHGQHRPSATISKLQPVLPPHCPKPRVQAVAPPMVPMEAQPIYANMAELAARGGSQSDTSPDDGEPTTPTTPASNPLAQRQQDTTSLELAKAIKELEASTAALTSAYSGPQPASYAPAPTQPPPISGPPPPQASTQPPADPTVAVNNEGARAFDAESYTSKTSLQCSSGYGTMNSTPAGSEDTIASGGLPGPIPEVAESPDDDCFVDGEGIPVSGTQSASGVGRRSSVNAAPKPPPPVRRTSSVTGAAPVHVQKLRNSPPRQVSVDSAVLQQQAFYQQQHMYQHQQQQSYQHQQHQQQQGGVPAEPLYAELNQGHKRRQDFPHAPPPPTQDMPGHSGNTGGNGPMSTMNVIQSLNAKFASLNSQYQEGNGYDEAAETSTVKPPPPAVMQKPNKSGIPLPPSLVAQKQQQHRISAGAVQQHPRQGPKPAQLPQPHPKQNRVLDQHRQHSHHAPHHHSASVSNSHHHNRQQQQHQQHHHQQQHHPAPASLPEDFPLPPTEEELQEIERIYSVPPPVGSSVRGPPTAPKLPAQQQLQQQHQTHHQQQQQQQQQPNAQASLMMELKRRVSVDDSSQA